MQQVINDPVHGLMSWSAAPGLWTFIDHPLVQRMRHIKQLGMADLIFPGAVHTRLSHSFGVTHVGGRMMEALLRFDAPLGDPRVLVLACLLHDLGHGPYSHAFESLTCQPPFTPVTHEDWLPYFFRALQADPDFWERCRNGGAVYGPEILDAVLAVLQGESGAQGVLPGALISSVLDADRMDYLLRDSHFCGVSYGQFDCSWLLHCLRPVETAQGWCLGLSYRGVSVAESYLLARRGMIHNVYGHPKIRRAQAMMMQFLAVCAGILDHPFLRFLQASPLEGFLRSLERYRQGHTHKAGFMEEAFPFYRYLTDFHVFSCVEQVARTASAAPFPELGILAERLYLRTLPMILPIDPAQLESIEARVAACKAQWGLLDWQIGVMDLQPAERTDATGVWVQGGCGAEYLSLEPRTLFDPPRCLGVYIDKPVWAQVSEAWKDLRSRRHGSR